MDPIKNIISEVMGRMSSGTGASSKEIQAAWARIAGQGSRAVDFKNGCVTVHVDTSMRLVRLNLNRQALLKELGAEFPEIKKICFKVALV